MCYNKNIGSPRYVAKRRSILFQKVEKASFVDKDKLPVYHMKDIDFCIFSGKRKKRGLYRTGNGIFINADCNGSGNIIRKVFPDAFQGRGDRGVVGTPKVLSIA